MNIRNSIECYLLSRGSEGEIQVLLLHKREGRNHPPFWQPITGGMEKGELEKQACIREVMEETGINLDCLNVKQLTDYEHSFRVEEYDLFVTKSLFVSFIDKNKIEVKISEEHDDYRWTELSKAKDFLYWESNKKSYKFINDKINEGKLLLY